MLLWVHSSFVHEPESLVEMIVIQNCEMLEMNEKESDGVETETDVWQIQNLQFETPGRLVLVNLLSCLVDASQISKEDHLGTVH